MCRGASHKHAQQHKTDLSDVIDVLGRVPACQGSTDALQLLHTPTQAAPIEAEGMVQGGNAYCLRSCPGCVWLPGWLTAEAQLRLATDALTRFPEPPATTNHSAQYGGLHGIWYAAQADKVLERAEELSEWKFEWHWEESEPRHRNKRGGFMPEVLPAQRLLRHLRWASLGPQYGVLSPPSSSGCSVCLPSAALHFDASHRPSRLDRTSCC